MAPEVDDADHDGVAATRQGTAAAARALSAVGFVELGSLLGAGGGAGALELKLDLGGGVLLQLTRR